MPGSMESSHLPGLTTFGDLLLYLRRRQRMTQQELAEATGFSTSQISRLEQNRRLPNLEQLDKLFVPALGLEEEPELAARLYTLAQAAHNARASDVLLSVSDDPDAAVPIELRAAAVATQTPPQLLLTKLFVPRPRAYRVGRPGLRTRLDAALQGPVTLVSAPAGFGKTTLLAEWSATASAQQAPAVAWLALDSNDDEPHTFVRYLIAACQRLDATLGRTAAALLDSPQPPTAEAALQLLLNDLALLQHDGVLVLDDCHLISAPTTLAIFAQFAEHLPPSMHLVLLTRVDPPLPLARLRARGLLAELRPNDLRFALAEADTFLTEVMGLPLDADAIAALERRTEGWVAGLQLAALALRDRHDAGAFIQAFTGSNRYVLDYLGAEVLERQPPHVQTFLLQTAILDRLCGALCDAVMGVGADPATPDAAYTQTLLEELERTNLFLVPLDDERRWYRYHQLFGEVLRERLNSGAAAAEVATLHRRASAWYAQQELIEDAIAHALAAGEPEIAAALVEQRAETLIIHSEMTTLRRWIERIPPAVVHARRRLALAFAGVLLAMGEVAAVEPLLQAAERAAPPAASALAAAVDEPGGAASDRGWLDELAGYTAAMRSIVARVGGDLPSAIRLGHTALELLPARFVFMRSAATWNVGIAHWLHGDLTAADAVIGQVVAINVDPGQVYAYVSAITSLGQIRVIRGRLHEAAQLYRQALDHTAVLQVLPPAVGLIHVGLAEVLREWNDLAGAARHLRDGIVLGKRFGSVDVLIAAYTAQARVRQAQGDHVAAAAAIDKAQQLAPGRVHMLDVSQLARALLAQGAIASAESWATRNGTTADTPTSYATEVEQIILARVLLARGAFEVARRLLAQLVAAAAAGGRTGTLIEVLTLQALAYTGCRQPDAAVASLDRALQLAAPEDYLRIFVDEGPALRALVQACRAPQAYVARLIEAFPTS